MSQTAFTPIQGPEIPDGQYRIASPQRKPKVYLQIRDDNGIDAADLDLKNDAQLFTIKNIANKQITIQSVKKGTYLHNVTFPNKPGEAFPFGRQDAFGWGIRHDSKFGFEILSTTGDGRVLDLNKDNYVIMWEDNDHGNQHWHLEAAQNPPPPKVNNLGTLQNGTTYIILNGKALDRCVDLSGADSKSIISFSIHEGPNQRWTLEEKDGGCTFKSQSGDRYLGLASQARNGLGLTAVSQAFIWHAKVDDADPSVHRIFVPGTNFNLDLTDFGNEKLSNKVQIWDKNSGKHQTWKFRAVH